MCSVSVTSLIYSSGNQRTWTSPGPLVLARAKGMRGCGENTVSCSCRPLALTFKQRLFLYLGDSKKQKSKKKKKRKRKKKLPRHKNQDLRCTTQDKPELIQGLNKISAARVSQLPELSPGFVIYWGLAGGWAEGDPLSRLQYSQIIFFFAHMKSPE